jgi:PHD/YefM family antitoxin component YafN of YafNO toxin-antitoxin module
MAISAIPHIDPSVKFVGVSKLRDLNAAKLRSNNETTYVLQDNDQPVAVLLSYDMYLLMQQQLLQGRVNTIEMLTNEKEFEALKSGLQDLNAGRVRPFSDVEAEVKTKNDKTKP